MYTELSIEVTLQLLFTDTVIGASQMPQWVKNLLAIQVTWVWSLGLEDPLEEGMAIHSCILGWRIPWTEEPGGLQSTRSQGVRHEWSSWACTHTRYGYYYHYEEERMRKSMITCHTVYQRNSGAHMEELVTFPFDFSYNDNSYVSIKRKMSYK